MLDDREVVTENQAVNNRTILRKTVEFLKYRGDIVIKTPKNEKEWG